MRVVKCGKDNHVAIDNTKNEMTFCTRRRRPNLKRIILAERIMVGEHTMSFNSKVSK